MAIAKTINPNKPVEIKVVGTRRDGDAPYIRLAYLSWDGKERPNGYIGSVCNVNSLRGLANQILRALDGE